MKVLVTRGAGFIGSDVAEAAVDAGHEVVVVDDLSVGATVNLPAGADFHPVDICNREAFREIALHFEAGVVATFVDRLLRREPIGVNARSIEGDDGCVRDYVYVRDAIRANFAALDGALDGRTINIATGVPTCTSALASRLVELVDEPATVLDGPPRAGDLHRSVLDPTVMLSLLGDPTPLERGLLATVEWFRERMGNA